MGRDLKRINEQQYGHQFQSTRPRGARHPLSIITILSFQGFNPRARVGRDKALTMDQIDMLRFNPRARVGRDKALTMDQIDMLRFNPRARVGRDD